MSQGVTKRSYGMVKLEFGLHVSPKSEQEDFESGGARAWASP